MEEFVVSEKPEKRKRKRPTIHWAILAGCSLMLVVLWPDQLVGLFVYLFAGMRSTHWVPDEPVYNAVTFATMAWHVVIWGPLNIMLIRWIWKRKHRARHLGFSLFGAEGAVCAQRLFFNHSLFSVGVWPPGSAGTAPVIGSAFWLAILVVNVLLILYFWKEGHTFKR